MHIFRAQIRSTLGSLASSAAVVMTVLIAAGCETLGQDLNDVGGALKPVTPAEAARMAVDPTDPDKRREGITLLSNAPFGGVEAYVDYYRDAVDHERDPIVEAAAIQALAKHGKPSDAVRIATHLSDPSEQVRWAAAKAMQRLHNPAVVPDLLKVLANESENQDVRIAIAQALGQYPEDRVFQGLVGALNARELGVNVAAEESLHTLTGMSFKLNSAEWLAWYADASKQGIAFAGQQEYLYPVYARKTSLMEKVAFWAPKTFEQPAPPIGLQPEGGRRTYDAADAPTLDTSGVVRPGPEPERAPAVDAAATQPATRRTTYGDEPATGG